MARTSKRLRQMREGLDPLRQYGLDEALTEIKSRATAKFDETIELAVNLGVDPRHADQMVRGMVQLPNGTGKSVRVAVFARGDKAAEAETAGADIVGAEDFAKEIQEGRLDFDRAIATPDMMPVVGRLGKILGPRGLMPNPKLGTVTQDVAGAIKAAKAGSVEFRAEKAGIVHAGVGKVSFADQALAENILAFVGALVRAKPSGAKGTYLKKAAISSSMGPSVKLDIARLSAEMSGPVV
jgi:large subunit ribosomal protein L1